MVCKMYNNYSAHIYFASVIVLQSLQNKATSFSQDNPSNYQNVSLQYHAVCTCMYMQVCVCVCTVYVKLDVFTVLLYI